MDTLFDCIADNNWDGFEHHLKNSALTLQMALSLAEHALTHDRSDMLECILDCAAFHSTMEVKTTLAIKAMRLEKHECFSVVFEGLHTLARYECLRDCVMCGRKPFLKPITSKIEPKQCWRVLEYAAQQPNSDILDHLLDVCPIPFETDITIFEGYAPLITDIAMDVINLGWNNCLGRILNLTPKKYDATEICVVACENENWEGARIALHFTSEDKLRAFDISFEPQLTRKNVGHFLCMLENERLNEQLTRETSNIHAHIARRKM